MKEREQQYEVIKEFSRFAHSYDSYSLIQKKVAKRLVKSIETDNYTKIIDIGCGSGSLYKYLQEENKLVDGFIAVDSSSEMLSLHPSDISIEKICMDFDNMEGFEQSLASSSRRQTILLSSSALQWSKDLNRLFCNLSKLSKDASFAIFTSNTFKTLHETASISSPIYSAKIVQNTIAKYYDASFELKNYQLEFNCVQEMFRYIKKSGVSGGEKQLGYKEIKTLMAEYPLDYLEFEILFVKATSLR